jgi:hypothetical protein
MDNLTFLCLDAKDWVVVGLSFLATVIWSRILYTFKPKLTIQNIDIIENNHIKIDIKNKSNRFDAVNIRVEACVVENGYTYHVDIDRTDFLMLPKKDNRCFQSYSLSQSAKKYYEKSFDFFMKEKIRNKNTIFRVRVYANHSFSGFGKVIEEKYQYDEELKKIVKS